jgi:hypothetical protein
MSSDPAIVYLLSVLFHEYYSKELPSSVMTIPLLDKTVCNMYEKVLRTICESKNSEHGTFSVVREELPVPQVSDDFIQASKLYENIMQQEHDIKILQKTKGDVDLDISNLKKLQHDTCKELYNILDIPRSDNINIY